MRDRRRFHRWDCSLNCYCWGEGFEFKATLTNLSFNGARVYPSASRPPAEGAEIEVAFLPEKNQIPDRKNKIKARVVAIYEEGRCFGIEFYGDWDQKAEILMPVFQKYVQVE